MLGRRGGIDMLFQCEVCGQEVDDVGCLWSDDGGVVHVVCDKCSNELMFDFGDEGQPPGYLFKFQHVTGL